MNLLSAALINSTLFCVIACGLTIVFAIAIPPLRALFGMDTNLWQLIPFETTIAGLFVWRLFSWQKASPGEKWMGLNFDSEKDYTVQNALFCQLAVIISVMVQKGTVLITKSDSVGCLLTSKPYFDATTTMSLSSGNYLVVNIGAMLIDFGTPFFVLHTVLASILVVAYKLRNNSRRGGNSLKGQGRLLSLLLMTLLPFAIVLSFNPVYYRSFFSHPQSLVLLAVSTYTLATGMLICTSCKWYSWYLIYLICFLFPFTAFLLLMPALASI